MATISEDFVSFETAKLLKEKGFDIGVRYYYQKIDDDITYHIGDFRNWNVYGIWCSMPTLQMAMKWLRVVHKISIEITSTGYLVDDDVEWECDIKAGHRLYFKHITCGNSFESVAEEAIKYSLENLI